MKNSILFITIIFSSLKLCYTQPTALNSSLKSNEFTIVTSEAASPSSLPNVNYHLTARAWKALNISRDAYLTKVEGVVREIAKLQNSSGAIIDSYAHRETQYSTPYFAYAVGALISTGRAVDLLSAGVAAMNSATSDLAGGTASVPDGHGEFFIAPLSSAITFYAPHVSAAQLQIWKTRMAKPIAGILSARTQNWRTYAMKGEWSRAVNGYVNKDTAINWIENSWINTQRFRFLSNLWNFYHDDTTNPNTWAYESVGRSNLLAMIADGYSGPSRNEMLTLLKRGTQSSLLFQEPSGQIATGGRSGDHTWNDILLASGYETMAETTNKEGNARLAGQYRHAAALAFQSVERWRQSNGTYFVTKNHFNPASRIGYATYSYFSTYNGNMMYHMAENYLRHKSSITEQPAPNEIGGYTIVTDNELATAVANAGGMHMQVSLRGSSGVQYERYWSTLGVLRFSRPGWDSRLGPSDGVRETVNKLGVSFAPTFLENGNWLRLASIPERYEAFFTTQFTHPLLVRCRVVYKAKSGKTGPTFTNDFIITPDGILSTLTSTNTNFGITWPILTFDGATNLNTSVTSHIASTSFPGQGDQQNFIALHSSPAITATDAVNRSPYGDLRPVRMISGSTNNVTFIYPRSAADPSAETVRKSFTRVRGDFSTVLGSVKGNIYVGRTAAGGVGTSIDINNDGKPEATFNISNGFVMQLAVGEIKKIETDRDVTAVIYGKTLNLKAYTPVSVTNPATVNIAKVIASSDDGNVASNTLDKDYNTRWSALGNNQWIRYFFDPITTVNTINIAWYKGNERQYSFDIQTSVDSVHWTTVFTGKSSGKTTAFETYSITATPARYVRVVGHGNNLNSWNAVTEVEILKDTAQTTFDPKMALNNVMGHLERAQQFANKTSYPRSTNPDGTIKRVTASDWTSGFFPGSLWLMYENTRNEIWRTRAEQWTAGLTSQQYNTSTHDVGFILYSSFGAGYRLTGNEKYKAILLQGAKSLASRYNPKVGCIKSWNNYHFPVIIDNMMNLEILFWATRVSGDFSYYRIAVNHALTTMANHFRPDNSSYHLVDYDPSTGKVLSKITVQGLNDSSDWARGQAWGLYGFTMCYRETKDIRFLNMAKKIADFYTSHPKMPKDLVPFWDFDASDYRDVSAASIASSALLELSQYVPEKQTAYYNYGINILKSISSSAYTASIGTNNDFVLKHGVGSKPKNYEVNSPLCYADYYFLQALLRYKKPAPMLTAASGNGQIILKWDSSTGATFYSIERSTVRGGPYTVIGSKITTTSFVNAGLNPGKIYYYRVTSWNEVGQGETSGEASATTNAPPIVSIISPANNATYTAPAIITINVRSEDKDGAIRNVKFYNGTTYIKSVATNPYTYTLNDLAAGNYSFTAKATDNAGAETISATLTIKVMPANTTPVNRKPINLDGQSVISNTAGITLAPNPANNTINIYTGSLQQNKPLTLLIISTSGVLLQTIQSNNSPARVIQLDVSSVTSGVYTIKIMSGDKVVYKRFVKL
ncbi:Ig-like domain-containing protein [Segetibacter koreensis]|uniref:Ig-like domain-containing protein n=1 Tax=Segetibacter koreensis TaxID=398037 RepID=UPI000379FA5B|nr:Ig-like domain-containing protein [Segetibacter koreensis]